MVKLSGSSSAAGSPANAATHSEDYRQRSGYRFATGRSHHVRCRFGFQCIEVANSAMFKPIHDLHQHGYSSHHGHLGSIQ